MRFLCMSWKVSPINKHYFPEYDIYFRMAICTTAIGQGLEGIPLGIKNFGVANAMLKLLLSLNRSYNWLSDDGSLKQQSIHFSICY